MTPRSKGREPLRCPTSTTARQFTRRLGRSRFTSGGCGSILYRLNSHPSPPRCRLTKLRALPHLKKLQLEVVDIPADDVAKLKAALPGVAVEWTPLTDKNREQLENLLKP